METMRRNPFSSSKEANRHSLGVPYLTRMPVMPDMQIWLQMINCQPRWLPDMDIEEKRYPREGEIRNKGDVVEMMGTSDGWNLGRRDVPEW